MKRGVREEVREAALQTLRSANKERQEELAEQRFLCSPWRGSYALGGSHAGVDGCPKEDDPALEQAPVGPVEPWREKHTLEMAGWLDL